MNTNCVKARFMNIGGLTEFVLPNGKHVLVDPYFTELDTGKDYPFACGKTREDIERVDYILISHTHADHDSDLSYFVEKFHCDVFCGVMVAEELLKYHKIRYDNIFPLYPGESFTNDDFKLVGFSGKHNAALGRTYHAGFPADGMKDHFTLQRLGSLYEMDFMLTTKNNFRILISGGRVVREELFDLCRQQGPNLLLRQSGFRKPSEDGSKMVQVSPAELAEVYQRYHAQIVVPYHHELIVKAWGQEQTDEYFAQTAMELTKLDPGVTMLYPKEWQWYQFQLSAQEVEE